MLRRTHPTNHLFQSARTPDETFQITGTSPRFLSVHGAIQNLFRVGRHHLKAVHHRMFRDRALTVWNEVTCAG